MSRRGPRRRVIPGRRPRRERAKITDWVQALSGLLAVMVAVPALVVAVVTYRDQQEINRSQLDLAQLERRRYDQRFVSRVAFWRDGESPSSKLKPSRMKLQNRSPVPIRVGGFQVIPVVPEGTTRKLRMYEADLDMPPCSVLTIELEDPVGDEVRVIEPEIDLWFSDGERWWELGILGLVREDELPEDHLNRDLSNSRARELPGTREAAADCGEGG